MTDQLDHLTERLKACRGALERFERDTPIAEVVEELIAIMQVIVARLDT